MLNFFSLNFYDKIMIIVRSIMKSYRTFLGTFYEFFYLSHIYFQIFLHKYNRFLHFHMIPVALLLSADRFFTAR